MHAVHAHCQIFAREKKDACQFELAAGGWPWATPAFEDVGTNSCAECWATRSIRLGSIPRYKVATRLSTSARPKAGDTGPTGVSLRDSRIYITTIIRR